MARAVRQVNDARCHYARGATTELGTPRASADSEGKDGALHIVEGAGRDEGLGGASSAVEGLCEVFLDQQVQVGQTSRKHRDAPAHGCFSNQLKRPQPVLGPR